MPSDATLHRAVLSELLKLLDGGGAHATLEDAVHNLPAQAQGTVPLNLPYSAWQILEHLRIAQRDIVDFTDNAAGGYRELRWPEDYWPKQPAPPSASAWDDCLASIRSDRAHFDTLLQQSTPESLSAPFPWGKGQSLLREAFQLADHNAYHIGELVVLRRTLGLWPAK